MSLPEPAPVVGVLLAAGAGRRLGCGPKALFTVAGEPQVVRMADALLHGGCHEVVVVLGNCSDRVSRVLEDGTYRIVVNEDWESGMASSFRMGVDAAGRLAAGRCGGAVVVALVDQPDIGAAVVSRLVGAASEQRVTAAGFPDGQGRLIRGHPIVFPLPLARQAAQMAQGDAAGRAWLQDHPELVDLVDVGHLASGRDVDTPADLQWWAGSMAVLVGTRTGMGTDGGA